MGGPNKTALRKLWVDLLGLRPSGTYRSERENVNEDILEMGSGLASIEVDLMEPIVATGSPSHGAHTAPRGYASAASDRGHISIE
jgi:lactoylglutathione lyase